MSLLVAFTVKEERLPQGRIRFAGDGLLSICGKRKVTLLMAVPKLSAGIYRGRIRGHWLTLAKTSNEPRVRQ